MILLTHHPWPCWVTCLIQNLTAGLGLASNHEHYLSLWTFCHYCQRHGVGWPLSVILTFKAVKYPRVLKFCLVRTFDLNEHETSYDIYLFHLVLNFRSSVAEMLLCLITRYFQTPVWYDVIYSRCTISPVWSRKILNSGEDLTPKFSEQELYIVLLTIWQKRN